MIQKPQSHARPQGYSDGSRLLGRRSGAAEKILKISASGPKADVEKKIMLQLRYEVARKKLEAGETDQAIETCRDIIKKDAGFTPARVTLGDAYRQAGRDTDAVKVYQEGYRALNKSIFWPGLKITISVLRIRRRCWLLSQSDAGEYRGYAAQALPGTTLPASRNG